MAGLTATPDLPAAGDRRRPTRVGPGPGIWAPAPLGPTIVDGSVGLSVYAPRASAVDVLLFDAVDDALPGRVVSLDRATHRTSGYWHVLVDGIGPGQVYGFRAHGAWDPPTGQRFDASKVLLDPYGRGVAVPAGYDADARASGDPATAMKSVVVDVDAYDWAGDAPLGRPFRETVIYEAHLRGFTADPSSGVAAGRRGTYAGFIDKIPYLVSLGITAVELLPVYQYDRFAAPPGRTNYWGYQPVSFFAPHVGYSSRPDPTGAVDEFRDLVKALHAADLEVILDVVYNHTAEVGADGPTFCFRGLADDVYYLHDPDDPERYIDASGTGNTFNANHPVVRRLILDSLRYWVTEMHVDGFRFDLASVLTRDRRGEPLLDPATPWDIDTDPALAGTKLIAEAWDAGGLYQVGSFPGDRWVEWNGRFRDDVRAFVKSDPGRVGALAQRLLASPDIYAAEGRDAQQSVNFVTCHDGFTLEDLVSYDHKHNEANGEDGRDGSDQNLSWNCGVEGPTDDPAIESIRDRQVKNLLTIDLLAVGVPMLLMGDEVRRTQGGNNNAYCQDGPVSWFDWTLLERHADVLRFTRRLIAARRRARDLLGMPTDLSLAELLAGARIELSGVRYGQPDLGPDSRSLALTIVGADVAIHLILNAFWESLDFELPPADDELEPWRRFVDTSLAPPDDVVEADAQAPLAGSTYLAGPRSVVVLATRVGSRGRGRGGGR